MAAALQGYLSPVDTNLPYRDMPREEEKYHMEGSVQQGKQSFGNAYNGDNTYYSNSSYVNNDNGAEINSFFDFEPRSGTASPAKPNTMSNGSFDFAHALNNFQPLSPPDSGVFPSEEWRNFDQSSMPHNILTQIDPSRTRTQFGQTTPPDDDAWSNLELQLSQQQHGFDALETPQAGRGTKRKLPVTNGTPTSTAPKRVRKSTARAKNAESLDPNDPEEHRRSKFLERNRVAASKCRQKKKEWTQNLENKARDLQRQNNNLRMMLDSCKEEILFLKEEMLKHTSCGCNTIQDYLKQGANAYETEFDIVKREPNSCLPSPVMSAGDDESHTTATALEREEPWQPTVEENLEALLRPQYGHNTSREGIAHAIAQ